MKWFQPIECDNTINNPMVCDYDNLEECGYDEWSFKTGQKITNWNEKIIFHVKKKSNDGEPDDVLQTSSMLPIYSRKLINELKANRIEGIQYLPIKIIKFNNDILNNFIIANIINFISAFDYDKSEYQRFRDDFPNPNVRGKISSVKNFVLYKDKLKGMDIIRLAEYEQRFFISEKFKDIFEKNKFTGYSFREIQLI